MKSHRIKHQIYSLQVIRDAGIVLIIFSALYARERMKKYYKMDIVIKVQFEDTIYRLNKGIASLSMIEDEMKKKFGLVVPPLDFFFQGIIVKDLEQLLIAAESKGSTFLQLQASPSAKIEEEEKSQQQPIQITQSVKKFNDESIAEAVSISETITNNYNMPKEFYACFNCEGLGVCEEKGYSQHVCQTCKGKGELDNTHKYIIRIKKLFDKYVGSQMKAQKPQKHEFQQVFLEINEAFEISITEINKIDQVEIGKEFTHKFEIQNIGQDLPQFLQLINCQTMESSVVQTLKSGDKTVIHLGQFICKNEDVLRKSYQLCYRGEKGWIRIGHRFGFRIRGFKNNQGKKKQETNLQLLKDLKMLSGSSKSQSYLDYKLKEMGIDINNIEMQDQILIQIIKGID